MRDKSKQTGIGEIPEDWKQTTLGKVSSDISYGYTASASDIPVGPKFLRITDIQGGYVDWHSVPYCQISDKDKEKYQLNNGDVCIARTGASTGTNYTVKNKIDAVFASYLIRYKIDGSIADPFYVGLLLKSPKWQEFVGSIIGGSAQPGANAKQFASFEFPLPPLPEQRAIAKILSDVDDKIELNRQINKTLESIAQAIFKRWFVDFDFPNEHRRPYKSSDGKMVKSVLGDIPEQWRVGKISDLLQVLSGFAFKSSSFDINGRYGLVTIKNVQNGFFISECTNIISRPPTETPKYCHLKTGDILLSLTGNVGRTCFVFGGGYLLNQRVAKLVALKPEDTAFVYCLFRQRSMQDTLVSISKGTAQQNLSPIETKELNLVIPSRRTLDLFSLYVGPLFMSMVNNEEEAFILSQIRDSLLPKLMSGKIRVN